PVPAVQRSRWLGAAPGAGKPGPGYTTPPGCPARQPATARGKAQPLNRAQPRPAICQAVASPEPHQAPWTVLTEKLRPLFQTLRRRDVRFRDSKEAARD